MKYQWIQQLVVWRDKKDWQTFNQTHQENKREDPNNKIRNERGEITTDTKERQKIIKIITAICKQIRQPGWNG